MLTGEKHLLLILKKNGKVPLGGKGMGLKNWCPAAILTDLELMGKIGLFNGGKKGKTVHIKVIDEIPTGNSLLDEYLEVIKNFKGKKKVTTRSVVDWVKFFRDKHKKRGYTEQMLWKSLEERGIVKNKGSKHIILKPEIKQQLYDDVRQVVMHKKEPDPYLKATVSFAKWGHGWRYYANRRERDIQYSKALAREVLIPTITFWEIVVEKRKAIGGGVQAGAATAQMATKSVVAASQYGVDVFVEGKTQAEATTKMNTEMTDIKTQFKADLESAEWDSTKITLKEEEED